MITILRFFKVLMMLCITGCVFLMGGIEEIHHLPIKLQAQQEQQITFTIRRKHRYFFDLHFKFKDLADRTRMASLVKREIYDPSGRILEKGGVPTPIRLTVKRLERTGVQEVLSIEREPSTPGGGSGRAFIKPIGAAFLEPGRYMATITPLETVKEFENTQVELVISYDSSLP